MTLAISVTCRCRPIRMTSEGAEPVANLAMLSRATLPSFEEGTVKAPIACSVDRCSARARRCTSYCSLASLNVVT